MRKAILVLAISAFLVPMTIAQQIDVGRRQFQSRLICGPTMITSPVAVQTFPMNNNQDFVGYLEMNVYNCPSNAFDRVREVKADKPTKSKSRRP